MAAKDAPSAAAMPLLEARSITKSFLGVTALDHVDFMLNRGEIHALLGENGAGKSTLIKILTGAYHGFDGSILLEGQPIAPASVAEAQTLGIGTVYQEVNLLENLTVAQNLFLGRQPKRFGLVDQGRMEKDAANLLSRYGLSIDVGAPLSAYSVAIRQIIAIARAVDLSGKVLVLDEPTASLDAREVEMLFGVLRQLKAEGLGIVVITHFVDQVYAIADCATVLRNGWLVGSRNLSELPRTDLISMMLGHQLQETVRRQLTEEVSRETVAPIRFAGFGKKGSVAPFDLSIKPGEAVGIAGLLGSGRTETALLMFGVDQTDSGTLTVDGKETRLPRLLQPFRSASLSVRKNARQTASSVTSRWRKTLRWRFRRSAAGPDRFRRARRRRLRSATSRRSIFARRILTSRSNSCPAATSRRPYWHAGLPPIPAC